MQGDPKSRIFTEEQVTEIVRRAALRANASEEEPSQRGVSYDELVRMTRELGLPDSAVDAAARDLALGQEGEEGKYFFGDKIGRTYERILDGELDEDGFEGVHELLLTEGGQNYTPGLVGRTFSTTYMRGFERYQITIRARDGRTRISVKRWDFGPLFGTLYPAGLAAFLVALIVPITGAMETAPALATVFGTLFGAGALGVGAARFFMRRHKAKAEAFVERLVDAAQAGIAESPRATLEKAEDVDEDTPLHERIRGS